MATLKETKTRHPGITRIEYLSGRVAYRARPFLHGVRTVLGTYTHYNDAVKAVEEYANAAEPPLAVLLAKEVTLQTALTAKKRKLSAALAAVARVETDLKNVAAAIAVHSETNKAAPEAGEGDLW